MKEIHLKQHLNELREYSKEVIDGICKTINILNDNYGAAKNIKYALGGYAVVVEDIRDIEKIKRKYKKIN